MKLHSITWIGLIFLFGAFTVPATAQDKSTKGEKAMTISPGKEISIEYTLKLEDKSVVDSNVGSKPLTYTYGSHQIIPGLEKALEGMKVGDTKQVEVKPEEGYGVVNKDAFQEVAKEQVPPDVKVGTQLQGQDAQGRPIHARVTEIKEKTVVLDFNHPLAGKTLFFDVKILNIQDVKK